jgi:cytoskeleton protein RodZ
MTNAEKEIAAKPVGPGAQLREARLGLKLQPENAAGMLRLSPKQILALENDDYSSLAGPTYVRGYLRGYAQLLGLSPEKIVEEYHRAAAAAAPPPVDLTRLVKPEQITSSDYRVKLVTLAGAALIIALSAIWWRGKDEPARAGDPAPAVYQTESGAVVAEQTAPPAEVTTAPKPVAPATTGSESVSPAMTSVAPAAVPATPTPVVVPAPGPRARLVLRAEQESWADVRDGNQNKLLYENLAAGRVVSVEGPAPLSVFLGNVDGVALEFNGRPYDAARHKRGTIARFTLAGDVPVAAGDAIRKDVKAQTPVDRPQATTKVPAQPPQTRPQTNGAPVVPQGN